MSKKKILGLYLTGGLGNQLFQIAAAMSFSKVEQIEIFEKPGKPRLNSKAEPELFSFKVDQITKVVRRGENSFLLRKSSGYILRSRIWPRKFEEKSIIQQLTDLASAVIQTLNSRILFYPVSISEVGYEKIQMRKPFETIFNPFMIGYFQSSVWPELVKARMKELQLVKEGPEFTSLRQQADLQRPIIVHVRRGDYKTEATFGLLGENYYRDAMQIIEQTYPTNLIWIFSDDESEARKILKWLPSERVRFIPDVDGESAASLMAMRLGCAYVIANSTFSWWGAFLSEYEDPLVIAPKPWFIGQKEPSLLIPPNWIRIVY